MTRLGVYAIIADEVMMMTIREAAQRVGKSESALRRAIKSGRLDAEKVNGIYNISEDSLNAYALRTKRLDANWKKLARR